MTTKKSNVGFQSIALSDIHESTTNPRRIFDESKLAFCAVHRFVAEDTQKRTERDGPISKGYITDERDPIAT